MANTLKQRRRGDFDEASGEGGYSFRYPARKRFVYGGVARRPTLTVLE